MFQKPGIFLGGGGLSTTTIISASRAARPLRNVSIVVKLQSARKRWWEVPAEANDSVIT